MNFNPDGIPQVMKPLKQWVAWQTEVRGGRPTKVPMVPGGSRRASVTLPETWTDFETARTRVNGHANTGLGFVLVKDIVASDFDHLRESAEQDFPLWALAIVARLGSYAEVSPSGLGLHVFTRGSLPAGGHKVGCVEMYDTQRYFTVTGNRLESAPATIEAADVAWLHRLMKAGLFDFAKHPKLKPLLNGDTAAYGGDESAADLGFCSLLVGLGLQTEAEILNAVKISALYDEKWKRPDYIKRTIGKALADRRPRTEKQQRKEEERQRQREEQQRQQAQEAARVDHLKRLPIDPIQLIEKLEKFFETRAFLPTGAALVLAYWALNTWAFLLFDTVGYLSLESAIAGCGKTTILSLLRVCRHALTLVDTTPAALVRVIHALRSTVLIDEAETLQQESDSARTLRAVAQAGYKRGGRIPRCVPPDNHVEFFDVFCPKVFAGIGGMSKTQALLDRSIVIHLDRKPQEIQLTRCRERVLERDAAPLREQMEAYALQFSDHLKALYEAEPDAGYWPELTDREAEIWGPLLIHARMTGAEYALLQAMRDFIRTKQGIQSDENVIAKTIAALDALRQLQKRQLGQAGHLVGGKPFTPGQKATFRPVDLLSQLIEDEAWSETFARIRASGDDAPQILRIARAQAVGRFLRGFRLTSLRRDQRGKIYDLEAAIEVLENHVPVEQEP